MSSDRYIAEAFEVIEATLRDVRPELLANYGQIEYEHKDDNSVVTKLDKRLEAQLKSALTNLDDTVGFYGEEFGQEGSQDRFWTIDPIDGTEAFIRGLPFCTNMLCLIEDGQPQAALIYNFVLDELFTAQKRQGAYMNGKRLHVSNRTIDRAGIEFEIKSSNINDRESYFTLPRHMKYGFSVAGYGFCQVAKGTLEARVQYNAHGKIWDYSPGALLVQEAGGRVANIGSDSYDYRNLDFIASNQVIFDDVMKHFS